MERFRLAVIGSGSGKVAIPDQFSSERVALIEAGVFGGTCVNRGCIPSKMFSYTADLAALVRESARFGLSARLETVHWPAIRDRIMAQIEKTSTEGRNGSLASDNVVLFEDRARFSGPHELQIGDTERIEAEDIIVATGGRPSIPPVVLASGVPFHTSDTVMHLESLPNTMTILGGGPVAVEMAHVFSSFGVQVHVIETASTLLPSFDRDIAQRFTDLCSAHWDLHANTEVTNVWSGETGVVVELNSGAKVRADTLLVATGRVPNTDDLELDLTQVSLHKDGRIVVDEFGRAAPGIWALGDCSSPFELKHVANAEARTIAHNLVDPECLRPLPHAAVPQAVFSDSEVTSIGARSQDLSGRNFVEATQLYADVAYGWAMQEHEGICKIYAEPATGLILGAHILGPNASLLITPLIQAMAHSQRVADLARGQYWIHPALSEVVENALLRLPLDQQVVSGQTH